MILVVSLTTKDVLTWNGGVAISNRGRFRELPTRIGHLDAEITRKGDTTEFQSGYAEHALLHYP